MMLVLLYQSIALTLARLIEESGRKFRMVSMGLSWRVSFDTLLRRSHIPADCERDMTVVEGTAKCEPKAKR